MSTYFKFHAVTLASAFKFHMIVIYNSCPTDPPGDFLKQMANWHAHVVFSLTMLKQLE